MPLDSFRIHAVPDDLLAANDYCYEQGWTDGLPVIPPAIDRVKAMLAYEGRPAETVIATHPATTNYILSRLNRHSQAVPLHLSFPIYPHPSLHPYPRLQRQYQILHVPPNIQQQPHLEHA